MEKRGVKSFKEHEIYLRLNDYEDIFSDFDLRPYSHRAMSNDFLLKLERASKDKTYGKVELKIFIPKNKRHKNNEEVIKKRLKGHFKKHFNLIDKDLTKLNNKGIIFTFFGVVLMFIASYIMFFSYQKILLTSFLIILLEPSGWFLFWVGMDLIIFKPEKEKARFDFYKKMSKCVIEFSSY